MTTMQVRQAGQIKHRPTRAELLERRERLVQIAAEVRPASLRHIYYRAVAAGLVAKNDSGYNKVVYDFGQLRESGQVPYGWIEDNGRRAHYPRIERTPQIALNALAHRYRRDPWQEPESPQVEIWCESRSIAGVLMPLGEAFAVPIFPTGGQSSTTFAYNAAISYSANRPVVVLYAGDYDPAGLQCGSQLEGKLRKHADPDVEITFRWLSITPEQATTMQALGTPPKQTHWVDHDGGRHDFIGQAIELEAVDPNVMRLLFSEAIAQVAQDHYGRDIFTENRELEADDRARLATLAERWS